MYVTTSPSATEDLFAVITAYTVSSAPGGVVGTSSVIALFATFVVPTATASKLESVSVTPLIVATNGSLPSAR